MGQIVVIERPDEVPGFAVGVVVQQHPVQPLAVVPFNELAEFAAHKEQLFAGVGHHVAHKGAQPRKFLLIVAGHFIQQRALPVHHLIVGDGQDKVFAEGVHHAEGELIVVVAAEVGVQRGVEQGIVHPAHVPFEVEAQPPDLRRAGDQRPCRGLLRDHQKAGMLA